MRFLHITDTHVTAKNPSSRLDVYYVSVLRKFSELGTIIARDEVDAVIHTGDLFHTSRVSLKVANQLVEIIRSWKVPVYIVPGNHDIDGYNISTINQTMLGMLSTAGVVTLLTRETPVELWEEGHKIRIEGQEYYENIDKGLANDYRIDELADFNILAVHSMLLDRPYFPDIPHTLIQDVQTDANMVLVGHYHPGFKEVQQNGTWFFNPGSLLRVELETRLPRYLIFDVELNDDTGIFGLTYFDYGHLGTASPGQTVFDFATHQAKKNSKRSLQNFRQQVVQAVSMQSFRSLPQLVQDVGAQIGAEAGVITLAQQELTKATAHLTQTNQTLKGYIEKATPIWIQEVLITNFQSNENTHVIFDEHMNVIVGETSSGKSSILRAILWCLYNDPKGTDFITTGQSQVSVKLIFSDGTAIERRRTRTSAGQYLVTAPDGTVNSYQGFSHDLPAEVMETHQMPEVQLAKDVKARLNVSSQLEGPFLLSESNLTKASIIGRIVGTQDIDQAIKELNKQVIGNSRSIKQSRLQVEEWERQLTHYQNLDAQKQVIDLLELYVSEYEKTDQDVQAYQRVIQAKEELERQRQAVTQALNALPDAATIQRILMEASDLMQDIHDMSVTLTAYDKMVSKRREVETLLQALPDVQPIIQEFATYDQLCQTIEVEVQTLTQLLSWQARIQTTSNQLDELPMINPAYFEKTQALIVTIEETLQALDKHEELKERIRNGLDYVANCQGAYAEAVKEYETSEQELQALIKEQHHCPLCGAELEDAHIEHIMKGES